MNKLTYIFAMLLLSGTLSFSQEKGQITGIIVDVKTGEALPGANILVANTNLGAATDLDGFFKITDLLSGDYILKISFIGYMPIKQKIKVQANKTTVLSLKLSAKAYDMDKVIVTGTRYEIAAKNIPLSVSVISAQDLEMKHVRSIDDALRNTHGLFFRRSQGLGTTTSHAGIRMRGTGSSSRTLIMKDGIPLNSTHSGGVSLWSTIAVNSINKIEVVRGAGSAIYGSNAMGGIVNLISVSPTPQLDVGAHVEYGTFGTMTTGLKLGKSLNKFGFVFSGEHKNFDGYQHMKNDDWKDYYKRSQNKFLNLNAKLEYRFNPTSVFSFSGEHHSELPLKATSIQYDISSKQNRFTAKYNSFGDFLSYSAALYYSDRDYTSTATRYDKNTGKHDKPYFNSDLPETQLGFVGWITANLPCLISDRINHKLTVGADGKQSTNQSTYAYTAGDRFYEGEQELYSGFINDEISIGKLWNVSLGLRYDWWNTKKGNFLDNTGDSDVTVKYPTEIKSRFSPKFGAVYHITPQARIRASYGTGFKVPGIFYMYRTASHGSSFQVGNPELRPEIMNLSVDIGTDFTLFNMLEISLTHYASNYEDFIHRKMLSVSEIPVYIKPAEGQGVLQYTNVGKVDIKGTELGFKLPFMNYWLATLNYANNKTEIIHHDLDPDLVGKELDDNPNTIINAGLQYDNPNLITIGVWLRNTGTQYSDALNTNELDAYNIVDLKIQREIFAGISASVSVYNAFNQEYYGFFSSERRYALAVPRTVLFGITYDY